MHTEDRLPGESKALEGVRRDRQDTGQVLDVSSLRPPPLYCFAASSPAETMAQKFNIPSVVGRERHGIWTEITRSYSSKCHLHAPQEY